MKKRIIIICSIFVVVVLIIGITFLILNGKESENKNNSNINNKSNGEKKDQGFTLSYKEVDITPGKEFVENAINEEAEFMELESCAFEGNDRVYRYVDVEITVSMLKDKYIIYSVYFLNETTPTTEGIKISDEKNIMIEKYGENYEKFNNRYTYIKDKVELNFIVENDIITSIDYTYNQK